MNSGKRFEELHTFVEARLSEYLDGALSSGERAQLENHLRDCARCSASLQALQWTVSLLRQTPVPPLPRSFTLPVPPVTAASAPPRRPIWAWGLGLASAAAAIVLVVVATFSLANVWERGAPAAAPQAAMAPTERAPVEDKSISAPPMATMAPQPAAAPATAQAEMQPLDAVPSPSAPPPPVPAAASPAQAPATPTASAARSAQPPAPPGMGGGVAPTPAPQATRPSAAAPPPGPVPTLGPSMLGAAPNVTAPITTSKSAADAAQFAGRVTVDTLILRVAPEPGAAEVGRLRRGDSVILAGRTPRGDWFALHYPENTVFIAWAEAGGIQPNEPARIPTLIPPTRAPAPTPTPTAR